MTAREAPAATVTDPRDHMDATYDGIAVAFYGDDSDLIALGHHGRPHVATLYRCHHEAWAGELDGWTDTALARHVTWQWARFGVDDEGWFFDLTAPQEHGAVPVSFLALG